MNKCLLFGFSHIYDFPCVCIGKKAFAFKLQWSPVKKRICEYHYVTDSFTVIKNILNGSKKFRFFGFMVLQRVYVDIIEKDSINQ